LAFAKRKLRLPVVVLIATIFDEEQFVVFGDAFENLARFLNGGIAGACQIITGGRDQDLQRLLASTHAGEHRLDLGVVGMLVIFVVDRAAGRLAVAGIADQGLEAALVSQDMDRLGGDLDAKLTLERRRALHHLPRRAENLPGLLLVRRSL
jgi:hypothetical protein